MGLSNPETKRGSPSPSTQLQGHPKPPQDSGWWPPAPAAPERLPTLCARAKVVPSAPWGFWGPPALSRGGARSIPSATPHLAAPSGLPCIPVAGKRLHLQPRLYPHILRQVGPSVQGPPVCQPRDPPFPQEPSQGRLSPWISDAPTKPARPQVSPRAPGLKPGCDLRIESGTLLLPPGVIKQGFGLSLKRRRCSTPAVPPRSAAACRHPALAISGKAASSAQLSERERENPGLGGSQGLGEVPKTAGARFSPTTPFP